MAFASGLSTHPDPAEAVGEVVGRVLERVGPGCSLAVLFATRHHADALDEIAVTVQSLLRPVAFIGITASAVLEGPIGVEDAPGLALWAGELASEPVAVHLVARPEGDAWRVIGLDHEAATAARSMILLADPTTFPTGDFLHAVRSEHPRLAAIGGLGSAGARPGTNRLVIGGHVVDGGAVAVLLDEDVAPTTVVAQIGRAHV